MNIVDTKINHGFWRQRKELNKNISLYAVLESFENSGRVRALTGDNSEKEKPHIFWESDLAKLMESAFFQCNKRKMRGLKKFVIL